MKMSDVEKNVRASAVMKFAETIRGAYESGFIDNHPTIYDIYRASQNHVSDNYGAKTENWNDELAKESRSNNHDRMVEEIAELKEFVEMVANGINEDPQGAVVHLRIHSREAKRLLAKLNQEREE